MTKCRGAFRGHCCLNAHVGESREHLGFVALYAMHRDDARGGAAWL